ncbi:MAG: hypothetical protein ACOC5T_04050 [Elusimicrobiota bacterium]
MINKKGEMLARDWVIAAVLFSGLIALFVLQTGAFSSVYDADNVTSDEFSEKFDKFENNTAYATEMWNQTTGEGGLSTVGTFDILFKSTFGVISLVFSSVNLAGTQMFGFVEYFGIPSQVGFLFFTILMTILTVIIIFIVISSVSRRDL